MPNQFSMMATYPSTFIVSPKREDYRTDDHLNPQHRWFASLLADSQLVEVPGGHKWTTWKMLWPQALQKNGLCEN